MLFRQVSFTIHRRERVGLIGRNGHGKTTLFRMICGDERPDAGEIRLPRHYTIGHLSQHIRFSANTILEEACRGLKPAEDGRDQTYRAEAILQGLGFTTRDFQRNPLELSGGFQVRLNLASVLVSEPDLLLLDEPTNYLDILSLRWLKRFLLEWENELILITHDRAFMDQVTTHTLGIHRCRIRKVKGPTRKLYQQIRQEEEVHERTRIHDEKRREKEEEFIRRFRAQATRARAVQSRIKALGREERLQKQEEIKTLSFSFPSLPFSGKRLLWTEDLSFSFRKESPPLIHSLNLSVGKNDRIAVIGKNGKGKSTLLNLLTGELAPVQGAVHRHTHLKTAWFGQTNINRLHAGKTVLQEILDAHPDGNQRVARNICGAMMFEGESALKKVGVLSGGERSRVLLGKLLVSPAHLLLLDEPTHHLDMESVEALLKAIETFAGAVIIVTHSERILETLATRLIVFDRGTVRVFEGGYRDFLKRVGWADEGDPPPATDKTPRKGSNKKEIRRARAEIIAERSKVLGSLKKRIAQVEDTIVYLEEKMEKTNQTLLQVSQNGEGEKIQQCLKSLHESRTRIDTLFEELETLTETYDEKRSGFDKKLRGKIQLLS